MATETDNKANEILAALLQRMSMPQVQPVQQMMPAGMMPAAQIQPMQQGFNGMNGGMVMPTVQLQPTGISITLSIPTQNGDVPVQLHFGPEHAQNIQGFLQAVFAAYGQVLKCYQPRQQWGGQGYGQGGYGQGGGYGGNGYGGRRWGRRY